MQAEVVRDSLLAVAGQLDETMGGHEIDHKQGMISHRRSLYFAHHGEEKMEFWNSSMRQTHVTATNARRRCSLSRRWLLQTAS